MICATTASLLGNLEAWRFGGVVQRSAGAVFLPWRESDVKGASFPSFFDVGPLNRCLSERAPVRRCRDSGTVGQRL